MPRLTASLVCALVLAGVPAAAQVTTPAPPGPYVVDLRFATSGLPQAEAFFPTRQPDETTPKRGTGVDVGGHVYAGRLGPARLGFGAGLLRISGNSPPLRTATSTTTPTAAIAAATPLTTATAVRVVAPQVSFNFGSAEGWSYISGGYGRGEVRASGWVAAINAGAGARWFMWPHAAVGFDLRYYHLGAGNATPGASLFAVSAGVSLR